MMVFDLVAAVAAGFVGAGLALTLGLVVRTPRWLVPVFAGAAMLGFAIWNDYSWFERTTAALPADVVVLQAPPNRSPFRPWTYLLPLRDRFLAVDKAAVRTHSRQRRQRLADVLVVSRYGRDARVPVLVDCAARRRADLIDGAQFDAGGTLLNARWQTLDGDDPLAAVLCDQR